MRHLCLAGGVALNCVANGRILREGIFDRIWIQPAAGDAGGALGAALLAWHQALGNKRKADGQRDAQQGSFLGPAFTHSQIREFLTSRNAPFRELSEDELPGHVARLVTDGKVIGWFQGRMEFGPLALGARSILGDARSAQMQELMNLKIKFRESFRPFAPSVLRERAADYFDLDAESPYMLLTALVKPSVRREPPGGEAVSGLEKLRQNRSTLPAVTHVDYSARVQTVSEETNPLFYRLIKQLDEKHGCPVIINTSFNVRGEPIVCSPEHAYLCFMRTNMDCLVMGHFVIEKAEQKPLDKDIDWLREYELD
jgi:carbamoyltransferase